MSKIKLNTKEELKDVLVDVIRKVKKDKTQKDELYSTFNYKYDYSSITDMSYMFLDINRKITIDELPTYINNKGKELFILDTKNVTNMKGMFCECIKLESIPEMDTSNVTDMRHMFNNCENLKTIPLLNTSNVTNMGSMFSECHNLKEIPNFIDKNGVSHSFDTSKVDNMSYMFYSCSELENIPNFDTSNVKDMSYMFSDCDSLKFIPKLNTSNVIDMDRMFNSCSKLETIPELEINKNCNVEDSLKFSNLYKDDKITNISEYMNETYIEPRRLEEQRKEKELQLRKEEQRKSIRNAINELRDTNNKKNEKNLTGGYSLSL